MNIIQQILGNVKTSMTRVKIILSSIKQTLQKIDKHNNFPKDDLLTFLKRIKKRILIPEKNEYYI